MKRETGKETTGKSRYRMILDGEAEPIGSQKGWVNLEAGRESFDQMEPERRKEIARKGAEAVNRLHGEKKTARESLQRILSLKITDGIMEGADVPPEVIERIKRDNPEATVYDLIQSVAVGRALGGNIKAAEYVRDTAGDKPVERIDANVTGQIMTDADREMIQAIADRLRDNEIAVIREV